MNRMLLFGVAVGMAACGGVTPIGPADAPEVIPAAPGLTATATNYFFATAGSDSNDCLSTGTACKTLAKIATWNWVPGSTINLNRGDTFPGTLYLFGHGTAGGVPPTFSGATWATVQPYGTGADPVINAFGNNAAIRFDRNTSTDAWKILNVDISAAKVVGIDREGPGLTHGDGLWIEGVDIANVTGANIFQPTNSCPSNMANPGYAAFVGTGIVVRSTNNVLVKTSSVNLSDMGANFTADSHVIADALNVSNTFREGIWLSNATTQGDCFQQRPDNITVKNGRVTNIGTTGMYFGVAGIQLNACDTCTVQDEEIDHVLRGSTNSPDGECFDDEGGSVNLLWQRINAHDCEGPAFLHEQNANSAIYGTSSGTQVLNCTFLHNATRPDVFTAPGAAWVRTDGNQGDHVFFDGNDVTRTGGTQFLYQTPQHGTPNDTPLAAWSFGTNTIH